MSEIFFLFAHSSRNRWWRERYYFSCCWWDGFLSVEKDSSDLIIIFESFTKMQTVALWRLIETVYLGYLYKNNQSNRKCYMMSRAASWLLVKCVTGKSSSCNECVSMKRPANPLVNWPSQLMWETSSLFTSSWRSLMVRSNICGQMSTRINWSFRLNGSSAQFFLRLVSLCICLCRFSLWSLLHAASCVIALVELFSEALLFAWLIQFLPALSQGENWDEKSIALFAFTLLNLFRLFSSLFFFLHYCVWVAFLCLVIPLTQHTIAPLAPYLCCLHKKRKKKTSHPPTHTKCEIKSPRNQSRRTNRKECKWIRCFFSLLFVIFLTLLWCVSYFCGYKWFSMHPRLPNSFTRKWQLLSLHWGCECVWVCGVFFFFSDFIRQPGWGIKGRKKDATAAREGGEEGNKTSFAPQASMICGTSVCIVSDWVTEWMFAPLCLPSFSPSIQLSACSSVTCQNR